MAAKLPWQREASRPLSSSGIVGLLVLALVVAGALIMRGRDNVDLRFARDLPAYQQITGDDVRSEPGASEASAIGRYTTAPVQEGQPLQLDELGPQLADQSLNADAITTLPALDALAGVSYPGDLLSIQVIGSASRFCPLRVLEIKSSKGSADRVVAAVSTSQAAELSSVKDSAPFVALRVWGYAEGKRQPSAGELCK